MRSHWSCCGLWLQVLLSFTTPCFCFQPIFNMPSGAAIIVISTPKIALLRTCFWFLTNLYSLYSLLCSHRISSCQQHLLMVFLSSFPEYFHNQFIHFCAIDEKIYFFFFLFYHWHFFSDYLVLHGTIRYNSICH